MAMKVEVVSTESIKPSSPTPSHLRNFKFCLLDQLAPPFYIPVVLFYSAPDDKAARNCASVTGNLKTSLSQALSLFYPLGGRVKGNASVDCNDEGALYLEAKAHFELSEVLSNPDINQLQQFLPFCPYRVGPNIEEQVIVGVQATLFDCGGIGIGICISHKIADGASVSAFLSAWSEIAINGIDGEAGLITPFLKASELFQPEDINFQMPSGVISSEKLSTKRFRFDGKSLARLRARFGSASPTRVEAVTALIWKSAVEAARKRLERNENYPPSSAATHVVNIRSRVRPHPLPENALGNLWHSIVAPLMEPNKGYELQDFAGILRKSIRAVDAEYLNALQGEMALAKACESLMAARKLVAASASVGEIELYRFSSWARFPFYEVDFGWGRPSWVCTTSVPMKNVVILMGTERGDGIEAWITLAEHDMIEFESDDELLQFVAPSPQL
ncbi:stemmadenine O-acetyltransferase-like [Rhodamnia argentea]|uniref:Stemmadenine O-acetyltransferase-like n=1 Tax=Rhodamnia argentea TaxID=178133 RepID=A0A8B8QAQ2_9MYRT|nr:stemmadenine O-acetyltransferase-like [Rhodamnia argentea]